MVLVTAGWFIPRDYVFGYYYSKVPVQWVISDSCIFLEYRTYTFLCNYWHGMAWRPPNGLNVNAFGTLPYWWL